jgi:hypothetical protein
LRGRTLPIIATAVFAERLTRQLEAMQAGSAATAVDKLRPAWKLAAGARAR